MCSTSGEFQNHLPSSHEVFQCQFSLISLQILMPFGFVVKCEELCRIALWTQLQPWILES